MIKPNMTYAEMQKQITRVLEVPITTLRTVHKEAFTLDNPNEHSAIDIRVDLILRIIDEYVETNKVEDERTAKTPNI